jgi:three-Cys-motif partner protein
MQNVKGTWGGAWTEKKLDAFEKYVKAYLTIMNRNSYWETIYFDGFAGSGTRKTECDTNLYKKLEISFEEENVYKGASERVLSLEKSFTYYYFIDKNEQALAELKDSLGKFQTDRKEFQFRSGDCNTHLLSLAKVMVEKPRDYAALVFLDPFGMQIYWDSIKSLAGTRSDIWILVPTGVIVNRLLGKNGELKYPDKLESFLGLSKEEISAFFYKKETVKSLFDDEVTITSKVKKPIEKIAKLYADELNKIWKFVTLEPLVLANKNGVPIFHFVFASNNENATKIAKDIIKKV